MELQDNGQYLISEDEVVANSEITHQDLFDLYGEQLDQHLKNACAKVYNIMFKASPNVYRKRNSDYLKWYIQQSTSRQNAMRDAIIEYIRGALYSGMDLREYTDQKPSYSTTVIDILSENGLYIRAEIQYRDEDIE